MATERPRPRSGTAIRQRRRRLARRRCPARGWRPLHEGGGRYFADGASLVREAKRKPLPTTTSSRWTHAAEKRARVDCTLVRLRCCATSKKRWRRLGKLGVRRLQVPAPRVVRSCNADAPPPAVPPPLELHARRRLTPPVTRLATTRLSLATARDAEEEAGWDFVQTRRTASSASAAAVVPASWRRRPQRRDTRSCKAWLPPSAVL